MSALDEIRGRLNQLKAIPTDELAPKLAKYGDEYSLLAKVESDQHRLLSVVQAVLDLADEFDTTPGHRGAATSIRRTITTAVEESS